MEDTDKSIAASKAARASWAKTTNRTARTAKARSALEAKFLQEAGGGPAEAERLRTEHYRLLARKSAEARRKKRESNQEKETNT